MTRYFMMEQQIENLTIGFFIIFNFFPVLDFPRINFCHIRCRFIIPIYCCRLFSFQKKISQSWAKITGGWSRIGTSKKKWKQSLTTSLVGLYSIECGFPFSLFNKDVFPLFFFPQIRILIFAVIPRWNFSWSDCGRGVGRGEVACDGWLDWKWRRIAENISRTLL